MRNTQKLCLLRNKMKIKKSFQQGCSLKKEGGTGRSTVFFKGFFCQPKYISGEIRQGVMSDMQQYPQAKHAKIYTYCTCTCLQMAMFDQLFFHVHVHCIAPRGLNQAELTFTFCTVYPTLYSPLQVSHFANKPCLLCNRYRTHDTAQSVIVVVYYDYMDREKP